MWCVSSVDGWDLRDVTRGMPLKPCHTPFLFRCHCSPRLPPSQYAAQKEAEEAQPKANGSSSPAAAEGEGEEAAAAANGTSEGAGGKPVSAEMSSMMAVDSKRALTAAIRAQVSKHGHIDTQTR